MAVDITPIAQKALQDQQAGRLKEAEYGFLKILEIDSGNYEVHYLLSLLMLQKGDMAKAIKHCQQVARVQPRFCDVYNTWGIACKNQNDLDGAVRCYRRALKIDPGCADAHSNLGNVRYLQGRLDEALRCYRRALKFQPDSAAAHNSLGNVLRELDKNEEAQKHLERALELNPEFDQARYNLAHVFMAQGQLKEAIALYSEYVKKYPDFAEAYNNLGVAWRHSGKICEAIDSFQKAVQAEPDNPVYHSNLLFEQSYAVSLSTEDNLIEHRAWAERHRIPCLPTVEIKQGGHSARPLRIGYVSPDFHGDHPVAYFIEPIIEHHNRDKVTVYGYANVESTDSTTARFQSKADVWHSIYDLSDEDAAELIRRDGIDILVDLAGHTAGNRLRIFTACPAPVQATYLGYGTTTGLSEIDYWLVDSILLPESKELSSEKQWHLPRCWMCYRPSDDAPQPQPYCGESDSVVFGSFNNLPKLTDETLKLWADILKAVPDACLLLKTKALADPGNAKRILQIFTDQGIDADRITLRGNKSSYREHLDAYREIDIGLDPIPYTGATTTCDALWMGVPVVTLSGTRMVERMSTSLLHHVGLKDWIARDKADYIALTVEQANHVQILRKQRLSLREKMAASSLCDAADMVEALENGLSRNVAAARFALTVFKSLSVWSKSTIKDGKRMKVFLFS